MTKGFIRWGLMLAAVFAVGPVAYMLVGTLSGADGGRGHTTLVSQTPAMGLLRGLLAVLLCCGFGLLVRRLVTPRWAYFCAGLALAWAAYGTGTLTEVLRAEPGDKTLWMLAVEALVLGLPVAAFAWLALPHSPLAKPPAWSNRAKPGLGDPQPVVVGTVAFLIAIAGAVVGAWLMAQHLMKGQTIAAAMVGGLIGAMAGHIAAPTAPPWAFVAGIVAVAVAGPAVATFVEKSGPDLLQASFTASVIPPLRVLPLDWLAGGLIGVPLGLAFAAGFVDKKPAGQAA